MSEASLNGVISFLYLDKSNKLLKLSASYISFVIARAWVLMRRVEELSMKEKESCPSSNESPKGEGIREDDGEERVEVVVKLAWMSEATLL